MSNLMPLQGQIFSKGGLEREIVDVVRRSDARLDDFDVIWKRPGSDTHYVIWLPYWKKWSTKASIIKK